MAKKKQVQARVVVIINQKGGVGKTTTAINLAHGLSRKLIRRIKPEHFSRVPDSSQLFKSRGHHYLILGHVLLVDFDPQGHCVQALGVDAGKGDIGEVLLGRQHLSEAVVSADRSADGYSRPNLWLLPASDKLERAKELLRSQSVEYIIAGYEDKIQWLLANLDRHLRLATDHFNFIVVDSAPTLDVFSQALQQFADTAIIPVKPDYLSMAGTSHSLEWLLEMQRRGAHIQIHTILPTFFMARQRLDREMISRLEESYGDLLGFPIPRSQIIAEAPARRLTIFEIDPGQRRSATVAYQKLVDRVYDD